MRPLISIGDLRAFRNVLLLAQSNPIQGFLPRVLPGPELDGQESICAVTGFDDAHADWQAVGATILQLLGGHKVQELVVAPVPAWFTPHLPQLLQAAERLALVDNFKAGQVLEQITVITLDEYHTRFGREAQALLIPTRDPRLEQVFREAFDSPLAVSTNRLHEHRLTALRDRYGDLPIYEASGLENVLAQVFQDNDLSKVVQFAYRHLTPGSVVFDVGAHASSASAAPRSMASSRTPSPSRPWRPGSTGSLPWCPCGPRWAAAPARPP
jgi:hypothetical protein